MSLRDRKDNPIHFDENPTQIADVETVVEKEGALARRGTDIDVTDFVYRSETSFAVSDLVNISDINNLIDEEIERVGVKERRTSLKKVTEEKVEE